MNLDSYFTNGFRQFLILTAVSTVIGWIIWLSVYKKIERFNRNHPEHAVSANFVAAAVRLAVFIFWFLIVAHQVIALRPAVNMVLSAGGIIALCTTFAAKESLNNYISGFLISIHKPYQIGDTIRVIERRITGTVEDITFRHTVIRTESGTIMTIPNAIMNSMAIEKLSETQE